MERTVPRTVSNEIGLYIRTYYSLLRSTGKIAIETLVEAHENMKSLLHPHAADEQVDVSALIYTSLRLPVCLRETRLVLLGQRTSVFERYGYPVEEWTAVQAKARRRRAYFNGDSTLALYISSRSDIDDIIPSLTAYQIEWNKLHERFRRARVLNYLKGREGRIAPGDLETIAEGIDMPLDELSRLVSVWGEEAWATFYDINRQPKELALDLLAGSLADYRKAVLKWWNYITEQSCDIDFQKRRVYFVSSNTHSLVNIWAGHGLRNKDEILSILDQPGNEELKAEYDAILKNERPVVPLHYLYYLLKKYQAVHGVEQQQADERELGICEVDSQHGFDVTAQIIPIDGLKPDWLDPRLQSDEIEVLKDSDALIINIDYPLGMAAYELLTHLCQSVYWVSGVYIMGKAATLNGRVGDVMIPTVVHDEHSSNTYLFDNCFAAHDVAPYLSYGNVLDNQKSVTVPGTFLQNTGYMSVFYREGYTDIEMEAGPYLSAVYELIRPKRHPQNEIVSFHGTPLDIGMIHYASDTPLTKGGNLGAGNLSYRGLDPTYAATIAIARRIMQQEIRYLKENPT